MHMHRSETKGQMKKTTMQGSRKALFVKLAITNPYYWLHQTCYVLQHRVEDNSRCQHSFQKRSNYSARLCLENVYWIATESNGNGNWCVHRVGMVLSRHSLLELETLPPFRHLGRRATAKEPGATKLFCIQNCHVKIPHSLSAVRCSLTSRENPWHDLHHHLFVPSALAVPWQPAENPKPTSISKLASSSVTASFSFSLLLHKLSGVPSFPSFLHDLLVPE